MPQGLFNALFMGAKETDSAKKVIKFATFFGLITIVLGLSILFIPFEPLQIAINERIPDKGYLFAAAAFSVFCLLFVYKEKLWASSILVLLILVDIIITYIDTDGLPGGIVCIQLIVYGAATQATYFLNKQKKEVNLTSEVQDI